MPLFICTKCGCIDNTACGGNYWAVEGKMNFFKDDYANKNILCVECCPREFSDGTISEECGKWHDKFPKEHWSKYDTKENILKDSNIRNAKDYFEKRKTLKEWTKTVKDILKLWRKGNKNG